MRYIIDANNLAGKLGIIQVKNFDIKLIEIFKETKYFKNKDLVSLVFDGYEPLGDRYVDNSGRLEIIYAAQSEGADRRIVELIKEYIEKDRDNENKMAVVTDDLDLTEEVKILAPKIKIIKARILGQELQTADEKISIDISPEEEDEITKELLDIWK